MSRQEIRQLEKMIEIISRAIPKETAAAKLYQRTAKEAAREMTRMLFGKLAKQAGEHESKLRATLAILRQELERVKHPDHTTAKPQQPSPAQEFNINIRRTLQLSTEMKSLGEEGLASANDQSCQHLYQTMLEQAKELRALAEEEVEKHLTKDKWD